MSTDEATNQCIELNETIQVLIKETLSSIDIDIEHIKNETIALGASKIGASYVNPKSNYIYKQFFRTHDNECPPANEVSIERLRLKETNVADDLNSTLHKLTQVEAIKLLLAIIDRYRLALQSKLNERIERLTDSLTQMDKIFVERKKIYLELQQAEKELNKSRKILSSAVPQEITNCIASLCSVISDSTPWTNKFDEIVKCKTQSSKRYSLSIPEWITILNSAHGILTESDWNHISLHVLKSVKSAKFCRLYWFHRLRPGLVHGMWSSEEVEALESAVRKFGSCGQWQQIADHLDCGRTAFSCFKAWHKYLNTDHPTRVPWSQEEDKSLDIIVEDELAHECKAISLIDWGVVSARLQTRSATACQRRYNELHNASRTEPFTAEEDLTLLKTIQRLGTGGGVYGWGTAGENPTCIGTWSVIAAHLPSGRRTAKECELRHIELCEKFQPWTYTEIRRLFQFASRFTENTSNETGPLTTLNILPYFPGRPMAALLIKMQDCRALAGILKRLRRFPGPNVQLDGFFSSAEIESIRPHLFNPPSILSEWVKQLRRMGVRNPEGYALSRLLAWKPRQPYQPPEGQRANYKLEAYHDFNQLLSDLEENNLLPSSSEVPFLQTRPLVGSTDAPSPAQLPSQENKGLHAITVTKLINSFQIRPVLFTLLSKEISRRMHLAVPDLPSFEGDRGEGKRKLKPLTRYSVSGDLKAGEKLLEDHDFFTKIFELALSHNRKASQAYYGYNPRALDIMAPELAGDMLFFAQQDDLEESPEYLKSRSCQESKSFTKSISLVKLQRILRIRQLLLKSRIQAIKSSSLKSPWTMPFLDHAQQQQQQEQFQPPLLTKFPDPARKQLINTASFPAWVAESGSSLIAKSLGVSSCHGTNRQKDAQMRILRNNLSIQLIPPNHSTILALKALLIKLPDLHRIAGGTAMRILRYRADFKFFKRVSKYSITIPSDTQFNDIIRDRPDIAALLSSPKHRTFVLRCFSLFLWPCLLANMRARDITDRSIAFLQEQSRKLVKDGGTLRKSVDITKSPSRKSRLGEMRTENPEGSSDKHHFRAEKAWNHGNFPNAWTQFIINCDANLNVVCELPSVVEDLLKSGFVPDNLGL